MTAELEGIFFYRDKRFRDIVEEHVAIDLFTENRDAPETYRAFWDYGTRSPQPVEQACENLKQIPLDRMKISIDIKRNVVIIQHEDNPNISAELDARAAPNYELRGSLLITALEERKKSSTETNETVYDALGKLIKSHHQERFFFESQGGLGFKPEQPQLPVIYAAVDEIMTNGIKLPRPEGALPFKQRTSGRPDDEIKNELQETHSKIKGLLPTFYGELDKKNCEHLRSRLGSKEFANEGFSVERKAAIDQLLNYREQLFTETKTIGIDLKNSRKAFHCHYAELLIEAITSNKPKEGQSYQNYMSDCIKEAKSKLTFKEKLMWSEGMFSNRLSSIVDNIRKNKLTEAAEIKSAPAIGTKEAIQFMDLNGLDKAIAQREQTNGTSKFKSALSDITHHSNNENIMFLNNVNKLCERRKDLTESDKDLLKRSAAFLVLSQLGVTDHDINQAHLRVELEERIGRVTIEDNSPIDQKALLVAVDILENLQKGIVPVHLKEAVKDGEEMSDSDSVTSGKN